MILGPTIAQPPGPECSDPPRSLTGSTGHEDIALSDRVSIIAVLTLVLVLGNPVETIGDERVVSPAGVGVQLTGAAGEGVRILRILPQAALETRTKLRRGDLIIKVGRTSVSGLTPERVAQLITGPAGSQVRLTIRRPHSKRLTNVVLTRRKLRLE